MFNPRSSAMFSPRSVALLLVLAMPAHSKVFDKCALARELFFQGIPLGQINEWGCVAHHSSPTRDTSFVTSNPDGSHNYGIFQINDLYWCGKDTEGKGCMVRCSELVDDELYDDVACALKIHKAHGFSAWTGYAENCEGGKAPDLFFCF